jgi:hypothetical protein
MWAYERRASTILYQLLTAGDERRPWILPANVCPIVPLTFLKARVPFEFVDIDETSLCLDLERTLARLRGAPQGWGGVLFVRTYGVEGSFEPWFREVRRRAPGAILVDDRCLGWPEFDPAARSRADVRLYSTGYAKRVDLGGGGHAWLDDSLAYARGTGRFRRADLERLDAACKAAIAARRRLRYVDGDWLVRRAPALPWAAYRRRVRAAAARARRHEERLNALYRAGLPAAACLPDRFQRWRFSLRVPDKAALLRALFAARLFASSHYAPLCGILGDGAAPVAARLHDSVVNLFNDRHYTRRRAERTIEIVARHLAERGAA